MKIVRSNIQIQLATRLKDITSKLKKREKKHFLKVQEIHEEDTKGYKSLSKREREDFLKEDGDVNSNSTL